MINDSEAADAARYRWLRDKSEPNLCAFYLSVGMALHGVIFAPDTVDSFIDASMRDAGCDTSNASASQGLKPVVAPAARQTTPWSTRIMQIEETSQPGILVENSTKTGSEVIRRVNPHGEVISDVDTSETAHVSANIVNTIVASGSQSFASRLSDQNARLLAEITRIGAKFHAVLSLLGDEGSSLKDNFEDHLDDVVSHFRAAAPAEEPVETTEATGTETAPKVPPVESDNGTDPVDPVVVNPTSTVAANAGAAADAGQQGTESFAQDTGTGSFAPNPTDASGTANAGAGTSSGDAGKGDGTVDGAQAATGAQEADADANKGTDAS